MEVNQKELLLFWRSSGGLGMQKLLPKVEIKKWSLRLYCHQMKTNINLSISEISNGYPIRV